MRSRLLWLLPGAALAPWAYAFFGDARQPWVTGVAIGAAVGLAVLPWIVKRARTRGTWGALLALAPLGVGVAQLGLVLVEVRDAPLTTMDAHSRATLTAMGLCNGLTPVLFGALSTHALLAALSVTALEGFSRRGRSRVAGAIGSAAIVLALVAGALALEAWLLQLLAVGPIVATLALALAAGRGAPRPKLLRAACFAGLSILVALVAVEAATHSNHLRAVANVGLMGGPHWSSLMVELEPRARAIALGPWLAVPLVAVFGASYLSRGRMLRRAGKVASAWLLGLAVIGGYACAMESVARAADEAHPAVRPGFPLPSANAEAMFVPSVDLRVHADGSVRTSGPAGWPIAVESGTPWSDVRQALDDVAPNEHEVGFLVTPVEPPPPPSELRRVLPYVADLYAPEPFGVAIVYRCPGPRQWPEGTPPGRPRFTVHTPAPDATIDDVLTEVRRHDLFDFCVR